jgi:hypothetical protein
LEEVAMRSRASWDRAIGSWDNAYHGDWELKQALCLSVARYAQHDVETPGDNTGTPLPIVRTIVRAGNAVMDKTYSRSNLVQCANVLNIHLSVVVLVTVLFDGLEPADRSYPAAFLEAIKVGGNLTTAPKQLLAWMVEDGGFTKDTGGTITPLLEGFTDVLMAMRMLKDAGARQSARTAYEFLRIVGGDPIPK